jgi:putative hydrolase of the HAD superfamily
MREVFVSYRIGARKPDAHAFSRMTAATGIAPHALAFFDDLEENVHGARRAGLMAWRVSGPRDVARILGL